MPATILQKKTPVEWQIRYHFCLVLQSFYSEYWKTYHSDSQHLLLGIQTLLHIYQIGWARGYSIRRILVLCKNAQMYYFEYLSQWSHMGIPLRIQDLLIFIYDHVLFEDQEETILSNPWLPCYKDALDELTTILKLPPNPVEKPALRIFETFYKRNTLNDSIY